MAGERPNIVVVICHDLGRRLGCYGVPGVRTPFIDAFAATGVRFSNSFCVAPQCSPSRAALWTGRFPHANGVIGLTHGWFGNDLGAGERHLAEILREGGYETHLFGLQHEAADDRRCGHEFRHTRSTADVVAAEFEGFVRSPRSGGRPLFLQVGLEEPHRPFPRAAEVAMQPTDSQQVPGYLPDIPVVREDLAAMEASISTADRAFGRMLRALEESGLARNSVIIFTADHGIPFTRAKMTLYDPGIEVALVMRAPGAPAGAVRDELISNVDLFPTLLEFAGLPAAENVHGRSFRGLLAGGEYEPNRFVFAEKTFHTYYDPMRAVRTARWKLIMNFEATPWQECAADYACNAHGYPEVAQALNVPPDRMYHAPVELYDLASDPLEQRNLAGAPEHRATRDGLIRELRAWMERTGDPLLAGPMAQGAYRQRMEILRKA